MKDLIKVLKAGPMLLLQDSGRRGFEEYGVSLSGAADKESYNVSNRLVFNNENDTVLEIFYGDVSLKFFGDNVIAISGGDLGAEINSIKCPCSGAICIFAILPKELVSFTNSSIIGS